MLQLSVICTVKNGFPYIEDTIQSVLDSSYQDFEFIIVDDGSTDGTVAFLESLKAVQIKVFYQENTGVAKAKNRAISHSKGKYIAIIDADDICSRDRFKKQVQFLMEHPKYSLVGGFVDIIDKDGNYLYTERKPVNDAAIRTHQEDRNPWTHSSVMFRREAFDAVGGYYEPVKQYVVDYMLLYQLSRHGKVHQLDEVVVSYRIVPTALSAKANPKEFDEICMRAVKKGSMLPEDLQRMDKIKNKEKATPDFKKSMYHLYIGRSFLFHNFQRKEAVKHLKLCLKLNPSLKIAQAYLLMSRFLPQFLVQCIYQIASPNAGLTYVRKDV
ncbi:MAG: glycosyltransferase involved in cell wall biosynthesis [Roseivirga sp.]|jgi:glycosyltransferase involved in cell wall biosynthesis